MERSLLDTTAIPQIRTSKVELACWIALAVLLLGAICLMAFVWPLGDDWRRCVIMRTEVHPWHAVRSEYFGLTGRWVGVGLQYTCIWLTHGWANLWHYRLALLCGMAGVIGSFYLLSGLVARGARKRLGMAVVLYLLYYLTIHPGESIYWIPGLSEYGLAVALGVAAISLLLTHDRWWAAALASVMVFLAPGAQELIGIQLWLVLFAITAMRVMLHQSFRNWIPTLLFGTIGLLISCLAPGNRSRANMLHENHGGIWDNLPAIQPCLASTLHTLWDHLAIWAGGWHLVLSAAVLIVCFICSRNMSRLVQMSYGVALVCLAFRLPLLAVTAAFVAYLWRNPPQTLPPKSLRFVIPLMWLVIQFVGVAIPTAMLGYALPERVTNMQCIIFLVGWLATVYVWTVHGPSYMPQLSGHVATAGRLAHPPLLVLLTLSFLATPNASFMCEDITVGGPRYDQAWQRRDHLVATAKPNSDLLVPRIVPPRLLSRYELNRNPRGTTRGYARLRGMHSVFLKD